jgi:hypothetical protein
LCDLPNTLGGDVATVRGHLFKVLVSLILLINHNRAPVPIGDLGIRNNTGSDQLFKAWRRRANTFGYDDERSKLFDGLQKQKLMLHQGSQFPCSPATRDIALRITARPIHLQSQGVIMKT